MILITCWLWTGKINTLFPFAREAIASLISKGGFPPLLLNPMNFEAIYRQHQQDQQSGSTQH